MKAIEMRSPEASKRSTRCSSHDGKISSGESVLLLVPVRTEVIEKSLDVLLHVMAERDNHRLVEEEQIVGIMPAAGVGPDGRVALILHQTVREILESLI